MILDKNGLKQIKTIVEETVEKSENRINKKIEETVEKSENRINRKIEEAVESSEKRVVVVINREVGDLAEINRDVIQEVAKIDDLEKRVIRIEHKISISG